MPPTLESILMNKLNLNYAGARNLVADAKAELHLPKSAPSSPELEATCFKLFREKFGGGPEVLETSFDNNTAENTSMDTSSSLLSSPAKSVEDGVNPSSTSIDEEVVVSNGEEISNVKEDLLEKIQEHTEEATEEVSESADVVVKEATAASAKPKKRGFLKKIFSKKGQAVSSKQ